MSADSLQHSLMNWVLVLFLACSFSFARAEDWTTTDGTTYHNVTVMSHDDAYVTIVHDDGGGRVLLAKLDPALQKRFAYDPARAAAAMAAIAAADQRDQAAIAQEAHAQDLALQPVATTAAGTTTTTATTTMTPTPALSPAATAPNIAPPPPRPAATAGPAAPSVDIFSNQIKIADDQKELDSIAVDLRVAERDRYYYWPYYYWNGGAHYDNTGTLHPNRIGTDASDRLPELLQRQSDLQAEIKKLQDEDASAATASTH